MPNRLKNASITATKGLLLLTALAGAGEGAAGQVVAAPSPPRSGSPAPAAPETSTPTIVQGTPPEGLEGGPIADIVVTAQRRQSRIQSTPVAITAVDGAAIERLGVQHVDDLAKYVPGFTMPAPTFNGTAAPTIRGIGFLSALSSTSSPVAFYVDGQFMDRPYGVYAKLFDIERIEVLRGPQGVLFGRNATAGAVRIEHALPDDTFTALGRVGYGSFNTFEAQGSVRGPVTDTLSLGIAADYAKSDGYVHNVLLNQQVDGFDARGVRGSLVWKPIDGLRVVVRAGHAYEATTVGYKNLIGFPNQQTAIFGDPKLAPNEVSNDFPSFNKRISNEATAEVEYKLPAVTVTALGGYNDYAYSAQTDEDGSPARSAESVYTATYKGYSGELRASSTSLARLKIDVGLYYLHEEPAGGVSALRLFTPTGVRVAGYDGSLELDTTNAYAVFGHVAYDLTDRLTFRTGVRYSNEHKRYQVVARFFGPTFPGGSTVFNTDVGKGYQAVTPLFGVDYKVDKGVFLYATAAKGFKSGGFNFPDGAAFDPETVWNYETGIKSDFAHRRVRLNVAGFYEDYRNLQLAFNLPGGRVSLRNAATAEIYGIEAETTIVPTERLRITGSLAWLHTRFKDYQFSSTINLAGQPLERAPEWKGSVVADYTVPTGLGSLNLQTSYTYEGSYAFNALPEPERSNYYIRPKATSLDARIELALTERVKVAAFGRNLVDKRYFASVVRLGGGAFATSVINAPRSFGAEVSFHY